MFATLLDALNAPLFALAGALMAPFERAPAWIALVLWSAVSGGLMTWAFRYTSNQRALRHVSDRIRANMLAIKLFKDELGVTFRCLLALMGNTALRLLHSLPPMIVMIIPFVLILAHLGVWYQHRPLRTGEAAVLELRLTPDAWNARTAVELLSAEGLKAEPARPIPDIERRSYSWRIRPTAPGRHNLRFKIGSQTIEKSVAAAERISDLMPASVLRPGGSFTDRLLYPAERACAPSTGVEEVRIRYIDAERSTPILGIHIPWWGTFLIVSILAALAVKPFVGVQF
ncbi:MAG: hypothetical protein CHACPFDD_02711 [Phycisphaerae bacterium]|nr:hypothetical protein [Phycisphaerae bacterium]